MTALAIFSINFCVFFSLSFVLNINVFSESLGTLQKLQNDFSQVDSVVRYITFPDKHYLLFTLLNT